MGFVDGVRGQSALKSGTEVTDAFDVLGHFSTIADLIQIIIGQHL